MKLQTLFNRHSGKRSASRIIKRLDPGQARMTLLFFVIFLIGTSIVIFAQRTIAQEKNQQAYDVACEVTDVATLKECIKRAKNKEYDLIKIMKIIECRSKDDCAVDLSGVEKAIKIYGITNTDTGFKRTGNFDYSLFTIKNSKDIIIGSFLVDDSAEGDCSVVGSQCPPVMSIEGSTNVTIDQLRTKSAKSNAVFVRGSTSVTIKNSDFTDSDAAALIFSTNAGTNVIDNNTFTHNHKTAFFEGCEGICTGAQMYIMPHTKNLVVSKNIIRDGRIDFYDPLGLYASGIDIAGENVEDVTISCNKIYNNSGNGIVIGQQTATKNITIGENSIYGNGIDVNVTNLPQNTVRNNCFDAACKIDGC